MEETSLILAGVLADTDDRIVVHDKFTGAPIVSVSRADSGVIDAAIAAAHGARGAMRGLAPSVRRAALEGVAEDLLAERNRFASLLVAEAGKPLAAARAEVQRAVATFRASARLVDTCAQPRPVDLGGPAAFPDHRATSMRVPVGACGFITPFNFPLNLVAHKVAPAIAAGCPFVLKPASSTPLSALALGELLLGRGLPEGAISVLPARGADAEPLATDPRIAKLSFTGSDAVGWRLSELAARKRVTLELGGNAAVVIDETTDLEEAVERILPAAFGQAGQSCISVQRIIVVEEVRHALESRLAAAVAGLQAGDPRDEATLVGPMIDAREARRLAEWIDDAVTRGGRVVAGGGHDGAVHQATLVADVPPGCPLLDEEAFGPVAVLVSVPDYEAALEEVNRSRFGLQAGVLTRSEERARRAWDRLEVGAVVVGDVPTWRSDVMPYGGVKDSGIGREGPAYAMEEMTELRLFVQRRRSAP